MGLNPVNQARWARFRHNRRGYWSLWIFAVIFVLSLFSELIANDKPLAVRYQKVSGARSRRPPIIRIRGYSSGCRLTAGCSGHR
ncbi:Oligopeptide transport system permease protein OppC (TC 3.A.1.5.1) [Cronobacter dublinensis 582]|nr:Oligopeptide transport system permease protein OppC (TC 3.A.1.5.1) [Cronobacter dublinensis 582]